MGGDEKNRRKILGKKTISIIRKKFLKEFRRKRRQKRRYQCSGVDRDRGDPPEQLEHQVETELFADIPSLTHQILTVLAHETVKRCSIDVGVTCCDLCLSDAGVEIVIGGQYKTCLCPDCQRKIGIGPDGERLYPNAVCRVCGCTDDQACLRGCHWVEKDLCSSCAGAEELCGEDLELEHQVDAGEQQYLRLCLEALEENLVRFCRRQARKGQR